MRHTVKFLNLTVSLLFAFKASAFGMGNVGLSGMGQFSPNPSGGPFVPGMRIHGKLAVDSFFKSPLPRLRHHLQTLSRISLQSLVKKHLRCERS